MVTLPCVEKETAPDPCYSIIWLHGLGADGNDFVPLLPELVADDWPPLRFVFPHAPIRPITLNNGLPMRAWYDIAGMELTSHQDETGIRESVATIETLIAREVERGIPHHRLMLAGFSQGGAITLATALRHRRRLAGIIALSTYLPLHESTAEEMDPANARTPIYQAHGTMDPIVQPRFGEMTRDWLEDHGLAVDWHSYAMGHQVCHAEVVDLRTWLAARFAD